MLQGKVVVCMYVGMCITCNAQNSIKAGYVAILYSLLKVKNFYSPFSLGDWIVVSSIGRKRTSAKQSKGFFVCMWV
jgi:hypothetical protein